MRFFANINDVCWHLTFPYRLVLNNDFAEQISLAEVSPRRHRIAELIDTVDHWMNVVLNQYVNHVFEVATTADRNRIERRLRSKHRYEVDAPSGARENSDQRDLAAEGNGRDRLRKRGRTAGFNNAIDAAPSSRQFAYRRTPLRRLHHLDDVVSSKLAQAITLCPRPSRRRNDACAESLCQLQREQRHAPRPLCEHRVTGSNPFERRPRGYRSARQRRRLFKREILRHRNERLGAHDLIFSHPAIDIDNVLHGHLFERAAKPVCKKRIHDAIADFESLHSATDGFNLTGRVR